MPQNEAKSQETHLGELEVRADEHQPCSVHRSTLARRPELLPALNLDTMLSQNQEAWKGLHKPVQPRESVPKLPILSDKNLVQLSFIATRAAPTRGSLSRGTDMSSAARYSVTNLPFHALQVIWISPSFFTTLELPTDMDLLTSSSLLAKR